MNTRDKMYEEGGGEKGKEGYLVSVGPRSVLGGFDLVKVVLVKLTNKGSKVVMLEVLGKNDLGKLVGLLDDKGLARLSPRDYGVMFLFFKHPVELLDKVRHTTTATARGCCSGSGILEGVVCEHQSRSLVCHEDVC